MYVFDEVGKYKKKSISKGQPRSKHKHIYETVLLITKYKTVELATGKERINERYNPTKVCVECGRVEYVDRDPKYYNIKLIEGLPYRIATKELSDEALKLPKWVISDYRDKFATKIEDKKEI